MTLPTERQNSTTRKFVGSAVQMRCLASKTEKKNAMAESCGQYKGEENWTQSFGDDTCWGNGLVEDQEDVKKF